MSTSIIVILIVNVLLSIKGFRDRTFFNRHMFHVNSIVIRKEYGRLVSSAFLHANNMHLFFNMLSFYFFAPVVVATLGELSMLIIYFAALLGGNLLSLYIHRKHGDYRAIGASGAVSGIVFAAIALYPNMKLFVLFIPNVPGYVFAIIYMLYSINGIRKQADNIGHEAHLGGAILGVLTALMFEPRALEDNFLVIALILVPVAVFLAILMFKPSLLMVGMDYEKNQEYLSQDDQYNIKKKNQEEKLNYILDKIHRGGLNSLTAEEKEFLDRFSK